MIDSIMSEILEGNRVEVAYRVGDTELLGYFVLTTLEEVASIDATQITTWEVI